MFGSVPLLSKKAHDKIETIVKLIKQSSPQLEVIKERGDVSISSNGKLINRFDFYASTDGSIESIAVYGADLHANLQAVNQTGNILGLKVKEAKIDNEGFEDYLDVNLIIDNTLRN
jgi:hypothetical protein|tara:strand:+ start:136 stop:483 length:348 start_codon:yes stop_codon:yes gene_type:complete